MTVLQGTPPGEYFGTCRRCGTVHRFRNDAALALQTLGELFHQLPSIQPDYEALQGSRGKMIGVLVVEDGRREQRVLRAFSGELNGARDWPGWVGPVLRRSDTEALERETLERIAAFDEQIASVDVASAQQTLDELKREKPRRVALVEQAKERLLEERSRLHALRVGRREASRRLSTAMFDAVTLTSARGETLPLREVFVGDRIAGGTADCSVPRLLEAANVARLRPIALAEAWWGPTIGGRHHGDVQPPCERKCQPILGHLLCGLT